MINEKDKKIMQEFPPVKNPFREFLKDVKNDILLGAVELIKGINK